MRSRLRVLSALLVCVGVVATSASAGTEQKRSAPPPVGRVLREMAPGAKSVIVFVSAGGKEYAATAGTRHPKVDQRFRIGSVTKTFTATIVFQLVQEGKLRARQHAGRAPAGHRSTRAGRSRSATCSVTARGSRTSRTTRNGSTRRNGRPRPVRSTACASRPPSRWRSGPAAKSATRTRTTSHSVS